MHDYREYNNQAVYQLGPETGQTNSDSRCLDRTDDESPKEGSQNCASTAEDGRASQEDRGQRA